MINYKYLSARQIVTHSYTTMFINRANYIYNTNMSAVTTATEQKKVLTPTQIKLREIQNRANAEKAKVKSDGFREDLFKAVKSNLPDEQLYAYVTAYKNNQDRIRKLTGVSKPRGKGEKHE